MLGKTHIAFGLALSLAVTQPATRAELTAALAGGAVGGWLCDLDLRRADQDNDRAFLLAAGLTAAALAADLFAGGGFCADVAARAGLAVFAGAALLLFGAGCALLSGSHRSFTHSLAAAAFFTWAAGLLSGALALPFGAAYASHLLLDLTNRKGLRLFFPLRKRVCLGLWPARGAANTALFGLSSALALLLAAVFAARVYGG